MKDKILNMKIVDALYCFDVYFDGIEDPEDYYVEFGRWVEKKINAEREEVAA